jgi:molybdate transport system ATP-binding protein
MLDIDIQLSLGDLRLMVTEQLPMAGITALFGPSGSGKTSLLRVLAGLEEGVSGRIVMDGQVWFDSSTKTNLPTHRRGVGYVFQDARLFSHLSVAGNLRFALRRTTGTADALSYARVVSELDLQPLLERDVAGLSGGERQRVALGRTILSQPRLLLLDEPLAALDGERKAEILPYLQKLRREFVLPTLYVSHAVEEIALLTQQTLVLAEGRVRAHGPTEEILERLDLQALTGRFEAGVVVRARVVAHDPEYQLTQLLLDEQQLTMPMVPGLKEGDEVLLRIRARDVAVATAEPEQLSIRNILKGHIVELAADPQTAYAELLVELHDQRVRARVTRRAVESLGLVTGQEVYVLIKTVTFDGLVT